MFGIGTEELLLILVIALVVLGPERMPKLARDLGRMVGDFRRTSDQLRNDFLNADTIIDMAAKSASAPAAIAPPETVAPSEGAPPSEAAKAIDGVASSEGATVATPVDVGASLPADPLLQPGETAPVTEADVATVPAVPSEPDETRFDREAREAREQLQDPARARQAAAEGWPTPSDEAGTTDRWG